MRAVAIVGTQRAASNPASRSLSASDRAALAFAARCAADEAIAWARDADAAAYARAAQLVVVRDGNRAAVERADLVLIGRGGCGERGDLFAAEVAESIGAALVFDALAVRPQPGGAEVVRDLGRGARDVLRVEGRVVVALSEGVERSAYISRFRLAAARQPGEARDPEPAAESSAWSRAVPRVRLRDHAKRVAGRAVERMGALFGIGPRREEAPSLVRGSAEDCARALIRYLRHHGLIEADPAGDGDLAPSVEAAAPAEESASPRDPGDAVALAARVRRRPRPASRASLPTRGPFQVGVDV